MKLHRILSILVLSVIAGISLNVSAGTKVCGGSDWEHVSTQGSPYGAEHTYACKDGSKTAAIKKQCSGSYTCCSLTPKSGYNVSGTCENASVYKNTVNANDNTFIIQEKATVIDAKTQGISSAICGRMVAQNVPSSTVGYWVNRCQSECGGVNVRVSQTGFFTVWCN